MTAPASSPTRADREPGRGWLWVMLAAVVVLALNLRLAVGAFGTLLPQIRATLDLSASTAGVLNALPTLVFAFAGLVTPRAAARLGNHWLVVAALLTSAVGQVLRALANDLPTLLLGSLLTLAGIAVSNVVLPGVVRQHFPDRITTVTGIYVAVLSLGATIGSGLSIPAQHAFGGNWRAGLGVWAGVALLGAVPWMLAAFRFRTPGARRPAPGVRLLALARLGLPWTMAGFFAIQAAHVYVVIGWLGQVLLDAGIGDVEMGAMLALIPFIAIALALVVPGFARRTGWGFPMVAFFALCYLVAYAGLIVAPAGGAWVWMVLLGLGGGTFPMVLTLVALRATTPDGVIALSAFTQCVGYLLASLGPLTFGFLHDLGDSWTPSLLFMATTLLPLLLLGRAVSRPRALEESLRT